MFRKGFTLVEILIAMALVGVLVAIVTPNLTKIMPDKKKALFIKAYSRTETAVTNMVNDSEMYPVNFDITEGGNGYSVFGLVNDGRPPIGVYCKDETSGEPNCYSGNFKFCNYFAQEIGGVCDTTDADKPKVTTSDGITYTVVRNFNVSDQDKTKKNTLAADITIKISDDDVGVIRILNDGTVKCKVNDPNSETDKCQAFLNDRYNFKQKR